MISRKIDQLRRKILRPIVLRINRFRSIFYVSTKNKRYRIVLNEKFEPLIKNASSLALIVSVILSFITLGFPLSVVVSIFLIVLQQLIIRVVFSFESAVLVDFPSFELWNKANFLGVLLEVEKLQRGPAQVAMIFENETSAKEVWKYIWEWNYSDIKDLGRGNIQISFVIDESKNVYAFFVYPSLNRPTIESFRNKLNRRVANRGKEQITLVGQMVMCKLFRYKDSGLSIFEKFYTNGHPLYFKPVVVTREGVKQVADTSAIEKNSLKIIRRNKLTSKDLEKFMCDYSIDWHDDTPTPASIIQFE